MSLQPNPKRLYSLVASMALALAAGCGGKPTETDTAEVTLPPSKVPATTGPAPIEAPAPAPEAAKEAPKE